MYKTYNLYFAVITNTNTHFNLYRRPNRSGIVRKCYALTIRRRQHLSSLMEHNIINVYEVVRRELLGRGRVSE